MALLGWLLSDDGGLERSSRLTSLLAVSTGQADILMLLVKSAIGHRVFEPRACFLRRHCL